MTPPLRVYAQGMRNTAHDLSATSTISSGVKATSDNEICKFCHAPHRSQSTKLLWNHQQTSQTAFTWGTDAFGNPVTATTNGTTLPASLKTQSKLCLGCHDGTVALGAVSNAGGGAAGSIPMNTVAGRVSGGKLVNPVNLVGAGGSLAGSHPVSIPYAGVSSYNGIASKAPAPTNAIGGYWKTLVSVTCQNSTGICTQASGADLLGTRIQLFPDTLGTTANVGVECNTCHEPHNKFGLSLFMRVEAMTSDALCRSCHNK